MLRGLIAGGIFAIVLGTQLGCYSEQKHPELLVFAASSLAKPLEEISEKFTELTDVPINLNFNGSMALANQITYGAPANLILFVGETPMRILESEGLAKATKRNRLLGNKLVLIRSAKSWTQGDDIGILADPELGKIAIGDPRLSPVGEYAKNGLVSLGLWLELKERLIFAANARVALSYVQMGATHMGIVYRTDAMTAHDIRVVHLFRDGTHPEIVYSVIEVEGSPNIELTRKFIDYLYEPSVMKTFQKHGYLALN